MYSNNYVDVEKKESCIKIICKKVVILVLVALSLTVGVVSADEPQKEVKKSTPFNLRPLDLPDLSGLDLDNPPLIDVQQIIHVLKETDDFLEYSDVAIEVMEILEQTPNPEKERKFQKILKQTSSHDRKTELLKQLKQTL